VDTGRPKGPAIYVGESPSTRSWGLKLSSLPAEGFVIRTHGRDLALAGRDDRGTMYAVYTFLEDNLGARWYAPDATVLPHHVAVNVPNLNVRESPAFDYRDTDESIVSGNAAWDAHLKLDGTDVPDDPTLGSINRLFNGAENFYQLVPPAKYFATHPEYFSLINGKRTAAGDSQLCLTNPDVFKIVTADLIDQARNDPKLLTLGLSPNDAGDGNCQCDNCKASDALYGAPSGTLIHFVNQVAAAVQAALPGRKIWVETLAYQYTEPAPRAGSIAPASNVLVCLAPIYACDGHPLATDPQNVKSNASLLNWSKVAPGHLQVWHYVTNFANYLQPYPDWDELGADMPYYRANGVSGMFCEGDYNSPGAETTMRTWVMAHLFWNPHQDVWKLVKDFCDGYYGPAGADIYQVQQLYHDRLQQPGVHLHLYDPPNAGYLTPETLQQVSAHFDHALAVADTPVLHDRVEEATLPLRYVELMQTRPGKDATPEQRAAFKQKLDPFVADLQRFHVTYTSEGGPASNWIASMEQSAGA
ncbi:MAG: DUF4838 domain-containing protein, partial [Chloroflexi bacterium]|nr:DUF4838 domain-containing protein [Chloroflexota bacterium]